MGGWRGNAFIYPGQVRLGLQHELPSPPPLHPAAANSPGSGGGVGAAAKEQLQRLSPFWSKSWGRGRGCGLGPCPWCVVQPLTLLKKCVFLSGSAAHSYKILCTCCSTEVVVRMGEPWG